MNRNDANTFKPYNPSEAIGSTTPSLPYIPPPQEAGCNTFAMIIMIVIAVVVTIFTAGAAAAAMPGVTAAAGMATGTAALSGAYGLGVAVVAGAAGGAAGAAASMAVGSAMGVASFSWREVAAAGIVGGLTAGVANSSWLSSVAKSAKYGNVLRSAISAGIGSAGSYAAKRAVGINDVHFSWRNVAASAISAAATSYVAPVLSKSLRIDPTTTGGQAANALVSGVFGGVTGMHVRRHMGLGDKVDYSGIMADAIGSMIGGLATGEYATAATQECMRQMAEAGGDELPEILATQMQEKIDERRQAMADQGMSEEQIDAILPRTTEELFAAIRVLGNKDEMDRIEATPDYMFSGIEGEHVGPLMGNPWTPKWSDTPNDGWGRPPTATEQRRFFGNMGLGDGLKYLGGMLTGFAGALGNDGHRTLEAFGKLQDLLLDTFQDGMTVLTTMPGSEKNLAAIRSLQDRSKLVWDGLSKVPKAFADLPQSMLEGIQSDFRMAGQYIREEDYWNAGMATGSLFYKSLSVVTGGAAAVRLTVMGARSVDDLIRTIGPRNGKAPTGSKGPNGSTQDGAKAPPVSETVKALGPGWTVYFPRGPGAATGPIPKGYRMVSRWINESELAAWERTGATAIPNGIGSGGRVYVTELGAAKPGGTGPIRIDFAVPEAALSPAGNASWFQIFQPIQRVPVYNVRVHLPKGYKPPGG